VAWPMYVTRMNAARLQVRHHWVSLQRSEPLQALGAAG